MRFILPLVILISVGCPSNVHAAACCAGNLAVPALISNDDFSQFTSSLARESLIGDAPTEGVSVFRAPEDDEFVNTLSLDYARLISDLWQVGASLPLVRREISKPGLESSSAGIGDLRLSVGFEVLPEYAYTKWQPKGYLFGSLTAPTGKAIYESRDKLAIDATGKGFWSVGVGSLWIKRWSRWDAMALQSFQYSFARAFQDPTTESIRISPGWGAQGKIGGGYSFRGVPLRTGLSLGPTYSDPKVTESASAGQKTGSPTLVWNTTIEMGYSPGMNWSLALMYNDQTLLGPATNTSLGRSLAIAYQQRWER